MPIDGLSINKFASKFFRRGFNGMKYQVKVSAEKRYYITNRFVGQHFFNSSAGGVI